VGTTTLKRGGEKPKSVAQNRTPFPNSKRIIRTRYTHGGVHACGPLVKNTPVLNRP